MKAPAAPKTPRPAAAMGGDPDRLRASERLPHHTGVEKTSWKDTRLAEERLPGHQRGAGEETAFIFHFIESSCLKLYTGMSQLVNFF